MIDTIGFGWKGIKPGPAEIKAFEAAVVGPYETKNKNSNDGSEVVTVKRLAYLPLLGQVEYNADGYFKVNPQSIIKVRGELIEKKHPRDVDNSLVLAEKMVNEAFSEYVDYVEEKFPFLEPEGFDVTRADICYQRDVSNSMAVLSALSGAVKQTRKGQAWFSNSKGEPTGIMFKGKAVSHRCYSKGLECGDRKLYNVLRSEEQLRKGSAGLRRIYNAGQRAFDREACLEIMNERYIEVAFEDQIDVHDLVRGKEDTCALLVLHPELMPIYRERVEKRAYQYMKKKVQTYRAAAIPDDLRLPESAWSE